MIYDFLNSLRCVLQNEASDYHAILDAWSKKDYHIAFMPAIFGITEHTIYLTKRLA